MRRLSLLFAVLFVVPLFGSDSPKEYDDKVKVAGIEGTWRLTEGYYSDQQVNLFNSPCLVTYRSGTYTIDFGDGDPQRGTYRIDTTQKLPYLDELSSGKGKTIKCIYQIGDNTLRIACIPTPFESQRPEGFHGKGIYVYTYKRVK